MKRSFIVPVYNAQSVLVECLDSILPYLDEFSECIIINDGSTDGSNNIAESYSKNFPKLFKLINQENRGLSEARNCGLDIATGDYVIFIDSDDLLSKDFQIIIDLMDDGLNDVISFNYATFENTIADSKNYTTVHNDVNLSVLKRTFLKNIWCAPFRVYKRHLFDGNRFTSGLYYEDLDLIHQVYAIAHSVKHVDVVGYYYRVSKTGIMKTKNKKKYDSLLFIYNKYKHAEIINPTYKFHFLSHICKLINEYEFVNDLPLTKFGCGKIYDVRYLGLKRILYVLCPRFYFKLAKITSKLKS